MDKYQHLNLTKIGLSSAIFHWWKNRSKYNTCWSIIKLPSKIRGCLSLISIMKESYCSPPLSGQSCLCPKTEETDKTDRYTNKHVIHKIQTREEADRKIVTDKSHINVLLWLISPSYVLDEGEHLTLHVFLVWLFPLLPPSLHSPIIPGARPGPMHLHLKWPSTFKPPLPQYTLTLMVCACECVPVCKHEHLSLKSSALLCAELMIILRSAPALHKPFEPLFTFYLQNNTRLTEPCLTERPVQMHRRQTAQTEQENEGGQLEPAGPSRSNERVLQIDIGLASTNTAMQRSACISARTLFLTLLPVLPPSYLPSFPQCCSLWV